MRFNPRDKRFPALVALLIAGIGLLPTLRFAWWRIDVVRGWEAEAIARSLVSGHGFSFPGTSHWLWEMWKGDPNTYFPTAWVDPVYTYILAAAIWMFGSHAYLAMFGFAFLCMGIILLCAFRIAARFGGPWGGALAVAFIAVNASLGRSFFDDISNSALAACALTVLALIGVRYFEAPSRPRLIALGLSTGLTVLTCPAAQSFLVFLPFAIMRYHSRDTWGTRDAGVQSGTMGGGLGKSAAVFALAAVVIAPWTLRNYMTFHEFVLVRNGAGQITWDGTVGTASTFIPGAARSPLPAPWESAGPRDAVQKMLVKELRIPIHHYQVDSVMAAAPAGYDAMNEAERDKMYLRRTQEFILKYPLAAFEMAVAKIEVFIMRFGIPGVVVIVLAAAGAVLAASDPRSWPLTLLVVSYCGPFILIIAYYGRYRAPVEPLLAVLAAICVAHMGRRIGKQPVPIST